MITAARRWTWRPAPFTSPDSNTAHLRPIVTRRGAWSVPRIEAPAGPCGALRVHVVARWRHDARPTVHHAVSVAAKAAGIEFPMLPHMLPHMVPHMLPHATGFYLAKCRPRYPRHCHSTLRRPQEHSSDKTGKGTLLRCGDEYRNDTSSLPPVRPRVGKRIV